MRQAVSLHCKHFIVKPFTVQLLLQTVREAINQRGAVMQQGPVAGTRRQVAQIGRTGHEPQVERLRERCKPRISFE